MKWEIAHDGNLDVNGVGAGPYEAAQVVKELIKAHGVTKRRFAKAIEEIRRGHRSSIPVRLFPPCDCHWCKEVADE